tara:strand:- start:1823 stop:2854 length:1032 start_codon:yes stop_codon:yes gene_type:complete
MGFKGLDDFFTRRDQNVLASKKLEMQEDELKQRRKEKLFSFFGGLESVVSRKDAVGSNITDDKIEFLKDQGYSDNFIAKVLATKNSSVVDTLLNNTQEVLKASKKNNKTIQKIPEYIIDTIEKTATFSDPSVFDIDIDKLQKRFKVVLDDTELEQLNQSLVTPGSATFSDAAFTLTEKPSLEDLDKIEKRALSENLTRAKSDLTNIVNQLGNMDKLTDPISIATKIWLSQKKVEIETAIENYKRDDVFDLAGLYSISYLKKLMDYYPNFMDAPINPAVLNASKKIITVPNGQVASQLGEFGLLREGEIVLNEQTGRPLPIGFDEEYWNSATGQDLLKNFIEQM